MPGYLQCGYYETKYFQLNTFPHISICYPTGSEGICFKIQSL